MCLSLHHSQHDLQHLNVLTVSLDESMSATAPERVKLSGAGVNKSVVRKVLLYTAFLVLAASKKHS